MNSDDVNSKNITGQFGLTRFKSITVPQSVAASITGPQPASVKVKNSFAPSTARSEFGVDFPHANFPGFTLFALNFYCSEINNLFLFLNVT